MSCFIRFGNVGGFGGDVWIFGRTLPGGWRSFWVVRWRESRTPEGEDIRSGRDSVGGILLVPEGGENTVRQRERISARARTPSGDTTKIP